MTATARQPARARCVGMIRSQEELGFYLLGGAAGEGPAALVEQTRRGEELGLGTAFISERWNVKEASSLVGAACAVTTSMNIATAATNCNTRHPLLTASWATTMHRLSGGRFTLGIGRGISAMYSAFNIGDVTTAYMETFARQVPHTPPLQAKGRSSRLCCAPSSTVVARGMVRVPVARRG